MRTSLLVYLTFLSFYNYSKLLFTCSLASCSGAKVELKLKCRIRSDNHHADKMVDLTTSITLSHFSNNQNRFYREKIRNRNEQGLRLK